MATAPTCGYMGSLSSPKRCGKPATHRVSRAPGTGTDDLCATHAALYPLAVLITAS